MENILTRTSALLGAIPAAATASDRPHDAVAGMLVDLQAAYDAQQLTPEEAAASPSTVQRLQLEEQLDEYITIARGAVIMLEKLTTAPDWAQLGGGTDADRYTVFFDALPQQDGAFDTAMSLSTPITRQQITASYAAWQPLFADEQLSREAAAKVRVLVDIRAGAIGLLRYLGSSTDAIAALEQGAA